MLPWFEIREPESFSFSNQTYVVYTFQDTTYNVFSTFPIYLFQQIQIFFAVKYFQALANMYVWG